MANQPKEERRVEGISSLKTLSRMLPARKAVSRLTTTALVGATRAARAQPRTSAAASTSRGGHLSNRLP
jgi:hypothetical protein